MSASETTNTDSKLLGAIEAKMQAAVLEKLQETLALDKPIKEFVETQFKQIAEMLQNNTLTDAQMATLASKLVEAIPTGKDKKEVLIESLMDAMQDVSTTVQLQRNLVDEAEVQTIEPPATIERPTSWVQKVKGVNFQPIGNTNITINQAPANQTQKAKSSAKKKEVDPALVQKVEHTHKVIFDQLQADKAAIEAKAVMTAEERLELAQANKASAVAKKNQAELKYSQYDRGVDRGKMSVVALVVSAVTFLALAFIPVVGPAIAAGVALGAAVGAVTLQKVAHNQRRSDAQNSLDVAKNNLSAAEKELKAAEKAAKPQHLEAEKAETYAKRLKEERQISEERADMVGKSA